MTARKGKRIDSLAKLSVPRLSARGAYGSIRDFRGAQIFFACCALAQVFARSASGCVP